MTGVRAPATAYQVSLAAFEGPLDMLLHLVREARLDITEISLAAVAHQYFAYLEQMHRLDVEIESSYLVVFAQLLELKSRLLLPDEPEDDTPYMMLDFGEDDHDGAPSEDDPLVNRLESYEMVLEAGEWLRKREASSFARYPRPTGLAPPDEPELDVSADALAAAMRRLEASPRAPRPPASIEKISLSVPERVKEIWVHLTGRPFSRFADLLGEVPTKPMVVVTFLAVLELAKRRKVTLRQEETVGEIEITKIDARDRGPLILEDA